MVNHATHGTGLRSFPACWELGLQSRTASDLRRAFSLCMRSCFEYIDRAYLQPDHQFPQHLFPIFELSPGRIRQCVRCLVPTKTRIGVCRGWFPGRGPCLGRPTIQRPDFSGILRPYGVSNAYFDVWKVSDKTPTL